MRVPIPYLLIATVMAAFGSGCTSPKFSVMTDVQSLSSSRRIVVEATCVEASARSYTTFRDEYFRILAMPFHTRWTAKFQVNRTLKGELSHQSIWLVDAIDDANSYSNFRFKPGQTYTIGFNRITAGKVWRFAVHGRENDYKRSMPAVTSPAN